MINHGIVRSTEKPELIKVDEYSVWVHVNIKPVLDGEFEGYEYELHQYDKDEYIVHIAIDNSKLKSDLIDTQLALVEIYEGMGL